MNIVGKILALLAFCMSGAAFAQSCTPYSIPIQTTVTDCGPGLIGSKYKTSTKTCPSGEVVESREFDTSNCKTAPTGSNGVLTAEARCRLTPGGCAKTPIAADCPAGRKWSLMGSGVAHCVDEDPVCPWGTSLSHDKMGNPSCQQNTCPSNQVLQADGKECGCPTNTGWNGSSCVPASCYAGTATTSSAACTYGGTKYYRETTSCPSGTYGAPSTSGYWDESGCAARPVTCTPSSYTESAACGAGRNGTMYREVYTNCPDGSYGSSSMSYGGWNESQCTASCTPTSSTYGTSCGSGYSGTKYITTNYTCPSGSYTTENTSGCGCANGAADYPTCTPLTPPPTTSCYYDERVVSQEPTACQLNRREEAVELEAWQVCETSGVYSEQYKGSGGTGSRNCKTGAITWY